MATPVTADYLQQVHPFVLTVKQRSYAEMRVQAGHRVLDVGCGVGIDTLQLAQFVGISGKVVGIDIDERMIAQAEQNALRQGVAQFVFHRVGQATALPFDDGSFDACRCERLLQYISAPETVLSEMVRVTQKEGRIVAVDTDWATLSIDAADIEMERKLGRFIAEKRLPNGYSGRRLYGLFRSQNLKEIAVEIFPLYTTSYRLAQQALVLDEVENAALREGVISAEELRRWRAHLTEVDKTQTFFGSLNLVLVSGCKSSSA